MIEGEREKERGKRERKIDKSFTGLGPVCIVIKI